MAAKIATPASTTVGCVIIGRNEGARLVRCLESIRDIAAATVYVDSGSTDGSTGAARDRGAIVVELDLNTPFTAARARNEGFAALMASERDLEFVQFADGDCEIAEGWIEKAVSTLGDRTQVAVVCGRRRERHPDASRYNWLCDLEWDTPVGEAEACGGDALMRRDAFEAVGGFSAGLMAGEEPELCARLRKAGWKILRIDADMTWHDAAMTGFRQWWLRCVRSGFGYAQVWSATRKGENPLYGRELRTVLFWGGLLPLLAGVALVIQPLLACALVLLYPLQAVRIAARRGLAVAGSWTYASHMLMAKFAEFLGVARFASRAGRQGALIEYKN